MKMMSRISVLGFLILLCRAPGFSAPDVKSELVGILDLQQEAWNRRDIEGFMAYYWRSDQLTYQSGANRLRGWAALLERYKKSYSGDNWGRLDFTDLDIHLLGPDSAYILGRWRVTLRDGPKEGVFTIIFRRFPDGWRIIHDHSS
jgi:L-asparaginase / beta-aspartyl-peptidase